MMEVHQRETQLKTMLGDYKIYVYEGPAFDAITGDLFSRGGKVPVMNEYRAPIWIHRALQNDPSRTMDPAEADIFFVPAYLQVSYEMSKGTGSGRSLSKPEHDLRLKHWADAVRSSSWYQRYEGRDHLFAAGDLNPGWSAQHGLKTVLDVLSNGYIGTFEMNGAWVGGDAWPMSRLINIPYVASDDIVMTALSELVNNTDIVELSNEPRHVSLYFAASDRKNAIKWANCTRRELEKLSGYPHSVVHVHSRRRLASSPTGRSLRHSESAFADHMKNSAICPLMCGDTPTSRRTYDAYVAGCVPLFIGTRLWGRCDEPCNPGWGWRVSGVSNPHLPWQGLWVDWRRFPLLDELSLVSQSSTGALNQLNSVLQPFVGFGGSGGLAGGISLARAYLLVTRKHFIYGFGDCRTSTRFGLAPRRLMESALFRIRNINTSYIPPSSSNHPLQPLQHTIEAIEAPNSESMQKYFDQKDKAAKNAVKKLAQEKSNEPKSSALFGGIFPSSHHTPKATDLSDNTLEAHHSDVTAMMASLYNWLSIPISVGKGDDFAAKTVPRENSEIRNNEGV